MLQENPMPFVRNYLCLALVLFCIAGANAHAQVSFDEAPVNYDKGPVDNPITRLQAKLDAGEAKLEYSDRLGYLPSVLENLGISTTSQMLVFSKTSFQLRQISPSTPRSLNFSDDMYIGAVQQGEVVEISAVDARMGAIFYSLPQTKTKNPKFTRLTHSCTSCHASSLSKGVPGHVVRSVYTASTGHPILSMGTYRTDHTSPLKERWGGWYVTGNSGGQGHLGNVTVEETSDRDSLDLKPGTNAQTLDRWVDTSPYLTPHSDIVALMVLEHQTLMHNFITRANFLTQVTLRDSRIMNKMLERPVDYHSDSTKRRIVNAGEPLVKYMLFVDEYKLTDPVKGTSGFREHFANLGQRDSKGRSLRDFDLKTRMFKFPCSYLIYSESFDKLPENVKTYVYKRLHEVLTGADQSEEFSHISSANRKAILEILLETKQGLPSDWKS
jgi:hypothetical protein